jgi:hypothetical protein
MMGGIREPGYIPQPNESDEIAFTFVGPDYFKTLGTQLVAGRAFSDQDDAADKFAIFNEKTAAHYWPSENAIGKHVKIGLQFVVVLLFATEPMPRARESIATTVNPGLEQRARMA